MIRTLEQQVEDPVRAKKSGLANASHSSWIEESTLTRSHSVADLNEALQAVYVQYATHSVADLNEAHSLILVDNKS